MKLSKLKFDKKNANRGTDRGRKAVTSSLEQYGAGRSVLIDRAGRIIAGNKTVEQALAAGLEDVLVIKTDGRKLVAVQRTDLDLTKHKKARALAIADNRAGELDLQWDPDMLADVAKDVDLSAFFSEDELAKLLKTEEDEDSHPALGTKSAELAKKWKTRAGQLWLCEEHRLLCGDSTKPADVKRLMNGAEAALVNMDPPYGVSYEGAAGTLKGDDKRDDKLLQLLEKAFLLAVKHSKDSAAFYIWHATSRRRDFEAALDAAGLEEKQYITWVKDSFVLGHADYHWQTEPCFYAQKAGHSSTFYGDRAQSTVWILKAEAAGPAKRIALANGVRISNGKGQELYLQSRAPRAKKIRLVRLQPGEKLQLVEAADGATDSWMVSHDTSASNGHPTPKPIELGIRAIENSSAAGEIVLDLFMGGGFTAIAAAKTGRACYGMELDPKYLAVTLEGLEKLGLKPRLSA
jgi:DNA modification methylase